jgi:transcriptional regulator with XRE-family HTH domain
MQIENQKEVTNKIRIIRQGKNISQEAIAAKLNITQVAYSKIENCKLFLTNERFQKILRELSVTEKEFQKFNLNKILNPKAE